MSLSHFASSFLVLDNHVRSLLLPYLPPLTPASSSSACPSSSFLPHASLPSNPFPLLLAPTHPCLTPEFGARVAIAITSRRSQGGGCVSSNQERKEESKFGHPGPSPSPSPSPMLLSLPHKQRTISAPLFNATGQPTSFLALKSLRLSLSLSLSLPCSRLIMAFSHFRYLTYSEEHTGTVTSSFLRTTIIISHSG